MIGMHARSRALSAVKGIVFAAACGLLLAACGGGSPSNNSSSTSGSPAANGTASGPATGSPIKIGEITDITGPFAISAAESRIATELAVDQANAHGGINGHKIEVTYVDAKGDPALALNVATQLVQQDHVDVLVGAASSAECLGIQQLAPKLGILYMPTNGCANDQYSAQSCNKYSFRIDPAGKQLVEPLISYLLSSYGKRWAVMYSDYAFGQSQLAAFQSALEKAGGTVVTKIPVPLGETNVTPYVTKVPTDGSIDGVFIGAEPQGLAHDVAGLQQFGVNKKLPIVGVGTREQFAGVYPDAVDGSIGLPTPAISDPLPDNQFDQAFEADFKQQLAKSSQLAAVFGGTDKGVPGQNGYVAYTAITALKLAMISAKFTGRADTQKLITAMENLSAPMGPDFPAGPMIMNKADHQGRQTVYIYKINGQKDQVIQTIPPDKIPMIGNCQV